MEIVSNRLLSNKVISIVSYPHGLSFRPNNPRYFFFCKFDSINDRLQFLYVCNIASEPVFGYRKVSSG